MIFGGGAGDTLGGGGGNNTIYGGIGDETLYGGAGSDIWNLAPGAVGGPVSTYATQTALLPLPGTTCL